MISDDLQLRAADLAFAILRFTQPSAHSVPGGPDDGNTAGNDWFVFSPSWRKTARDEVVPFLVNLDGPVMMLPTIYRGRIALLVRDEVGGDSGRWIQKTVDNQLSWIDHFQGTMKLTPESRILLEFAEEEHILPFAVLCEWARRYVVGAGWNLVPCQDPRADARLMLYAPGSIQSWGGSCPSGSPS